MTLDQILNLAIVNIRKQFPEALYSGKLVRNHKTFSPSTNTTLEILEEADVEIILDSLTVEEIQASGLLSTDLKFYVIGNSANSIGFYNYLMYNNEQYRLTKVIHSLVGSRSALWTVICQK